MTAAIALAIVLVIVVAGASMALESQRTAVPGAARRPVRPRPGPGAAGRRSRLRERARPDPTAADGPPSTPPPPPEPEVKGPDLLRTGVSATAKVVSVVDERTIGPVTRSRLTLEIDPPEGSTYEVTVRVAFPTPEARARIKVGGTVPVRYDRDDRNRVVVDLPQD